MIRSASSVDSASREADAGFDCSVRRFSSTVSIVRLTFRALGRRRNLMHAPEKCGSPEEIVGWFRLRQPAKQVIKGPVRVPGRFENRRISHGGLALLCKPSTTPLQEASDPLHGRMVGTHRPVTPLVEEFGQVRLAPPQGTSSTTTTSPRRQSWRRIVYGRKTRNATGGWTQKRFGKSWSYLQGTGKWPREQTSAQPLRSRTVISMPFLPALKEACWYTKPGKRRSGLGS